MEGAVRCLSLPNDGDLCNIRRHMEMKGVEVPERSQTATFFPRGAIAFFVLMGVFYASLWLAMYVLMAQRG